MIKSLFLNNFRNFKNKEINFSPLTTVIVGANASGKTNIMESVYLVSTGKSFHAKLEEEMINYNSDIAKVSAQIINEKDIRLDIFLTRGKVEVGEDNFEKTPRKKLSVNSIPRRLMDFAGNFRVVIFAPSDLGIVTDSPSVRRKFLDAVISQVDREYRRASLSYDKGLRQRNRLLMRIREEGLSRSQLLFWDKLLIKNGNYITEKRMEFLEYTNSTSSKEEIIDKENEKLISSFFLEYDMSAISESRLEQYAQEEIYAGTTLVGPHRDDFLFVKKERNGEEEGRELASYGSRGEQRMGVLWLRMAELSYIEEQTKTKATLLLDDIFSELDHKRRKTVFKIAQNRQSIITTADPHYIEKLGNVEKIMI